MNSTLHQLSARKAFVLDRIPSSIFHYLTLSASAGLLTILNRSWIDSRCLHSWRSVIVIPFLVKVKISACFASYHPAMFNLTISQVLVDWFPVACPCSLRYVNYWSNGRPAFRRDTVLPINTFIYLCKRTLSTSWKCHDTCVLFLLCKIDCVTYVYEVDCVTYVYKVDCVTYVYKVDCVSYVCKVDCVS